MLIELSKLKPNPRNPRRILPKKVDSLADSLLGNPDHFLARPVIADKNMMTWAGHQRVLAAKKIEKMTPPTDKEGLERWEYYKKKIGIGVVPCEIVDLPLEKMEEIMIRDNVSAGEWDTTIMADWNLDNLESWGLDFRQNEEVNEGQPDTPGGGGLKKKKTKTCPNCGHEF